MGIAIWKGNHLAEWQIKAFKGVWSERKLRDILYAIKELIESYKITLVAIKIPNQFHNSESLDKLIIELQSLARRLKVKVKILNLTELKKICSDDPTLTKADLIRTIADQNDILRHLYNREIKNKNPYYTKMFEAIAIVILSYQEYLKKHSVPSPFSEFNL
ncbi:MAG: hypothetical protein RL641_257 [Candidatus Parcubacteria bacterium]|jgi:RNase H-fold protein (predicted Holliday junction resolvase)